MFRDQYYRNVRISRLRHIKSHQNRWRNYQSRFHFFEHLYQNIKNFISLSMIWFACFVKSLNHLIYVNIKKDFVFSQNFDVRLFVTYQFRIIVYFLFAINQKTSINQNLKNSNSKNFQQHTFAKSISFCRFVLSEKSICSSYKNSNIFYISLQSRFSFLQSRFSFAWFRFTFSFAFSFTFSSFFRFRISNHVCCICFDHFNFRNDSFNYRRFNQSYFSNRRSIKKMKKMINRFETKLKKNEK